MIKIFSYLCTLLVLSTAPVYAESVDAELLYSNLQDRIYQIRVIDLASDKKSSIGSGFQITAGGLIATNYHVVAEYIHAPEQYRIEYLDQQGVKGALVIKDIDVIHDLAIVYADTQNKTFIPFSKNDSSKGAEIFSLGNPHDLGMTIIEGTYNGLLEKSLYEKILFSGSLNPGMSGGPALNKRGEVIGVNVSTAGNDLSFLVPAAYLKKLLETAKKSEEIIFSERMQQQLEDNQYNNMQMIMSAVWETTSLGQTIVPAELVSYFKCWGKTDDKKDQMYKHTYSACSSPDSIYISSHFETGSIDFRYDWYDADKLNRFQFYNLLETKYASSYSTNKAKKEDVTNYRCNNDFLKLEKHIWKVALCMREYKKFSGLYDLSLTMAQVDKNDQSLLVNLNATGMNKKFAIEFAKKFMESIHWQD
jgi:serine protease Do